MDSHDPPDAAAFRAEVRAWLDRECTDAERDLARRFTMAMPPDLVRELRAWNRRLADARLAAIAWPVAWGGRDAGVVDQVVLAEEMHRAGAPGTVNPIGLSNIAPAIIHHGTDEQRRRFLPRMLRGDDIWCQGFSEPDAGSDLASLRCEAVADGDGYVVRGRKLWTSLAHVADFCELLVRTDPAAAPHRGLTCLLVDMRTPGIEVRPVAALTGAHELNEMVLTDVRVPPSAVLGAPRDGWRVAMTTLAHERGGVAALHLALRARIARLRDEARRAGVTDRTARDRLARLVTDGEILRLLADRSVGDARAGRPVGPEGAIAKLLWSRTSQDLATTAVALLGPAALDGPWGHDLLATRSLTIAGGTTEVLKNVLAERVLGLPR